MQAMAREGLAAVAWPKDYRRRTGSSMTHAGAVAPAQYDVTSGER